jgi:hypothetical protein
MGMCREMEMEINGVYKCLFRVMGINQCLQSIPHPYFQSYQEHTLQPP